MIPMTRTLTLLSVETDVVDDYGTPSYSEASSEVLGSFRQLSSQELGENIDQVAYRVHLPLDTAVDSGDKLILDGTTVEVVGIPQAVYDVRQGMAVALVLRAEVAL